MTDVRTFSRSLELNRIVEKTLTLNLLPATRRKRESLDELFTKYSEALRFVVDKKRTDRKIALQKMFYERVRELGIPSMLSCQIFRDATPILKNGGAVRSVTIPFNIPRSGNISKTERGNPVVSIRTLNERIAIPIAVDGAYERFRRMVSDGWEVVAFRLGSSKVFVAMKHYYNAELLRDNYDTVLGLDVGAKRLAAISVLDKSGRILKQLYLGQDVSDRQRDVSIRRSRLTGYRDEGSRYARQALRRLKRKESHFTKTRSEQIAHEVLELARQNNSFIAIENLKNLNHAHGNRKGNRKSKRLPYGRFRAVLESLSSQDGRLVIPVYPRGTSHTCSRCGHEGIRRRALFRCPFCGYVGNADRNASVNIARRAALQRPMWGQISARGVEVMPPVLVHAGGRA
jgi:IS605 OrfB family transposase